MSAYLGMAKASSIVMLLLALFAGGWHVGAGYVQAQWDSAKAAQLTADNAALIQRTAENTALAEKHAADNATITKAHNAELAKINDDYARAAATGLRMPAGACRGLAASTKADSAGISDASLAGTDSLPDQVTSDLFALMKEADAVAATARAAQDFIRLNGMEP